MYIIGEDIRERSFTRIPDLNERFILTQIPVGVAWFAEILWFIVDCWTWAESI